MGTQRILQAGPRKSCSILSVAGQRRTHPGQVIHVVLVRPHPGLLEKLFKRCLFRVATVPREGRDLMTCIGG